MPTHPIGKFGNILAISIMTARWWWMHVVNKCLLTPHVYRYPFIHESLYANPNFHTNRIFGPKVILINNFLCTTSASLSIVAGVFEKIASVFGRGDGGGACRWTNFEPVTEYYHLEHKEEIKKTLHYEAYLYSPTIQYAHVWRFMGGNLCLVRDDASLRTALTIFYVRDYSFFLYVISAWLLWYVYCTLFSPVSLSRLWSAVDLAVCRQCDAESSSRLCKKNIFFCVLTVYLSGCFFRSFLSKVFAECGLIEQLQFYLSDVWK